MTNHGTGDGTKTPDFLTVEEAAAVVRIGRTTAYLLAREWFTTGGAHGLPVVRLGKLLRIPRVELERLLGGPITWPPPCDGLAASDLIPDDSPAPRLHADQPRAASRTDRSSLRLFG